MKLSLGLYFSEKLNDFALVAKGPDDYSSRLHGNYSVISKASSFADVRHQSVQIATSDLASFMKREGFIFLDAEKEVKKEGGSCKLCRKHFAKLHQGNCEEHFHSFRDA